MVRLLRAAGGLALRFAAPCGALPAALVLPLTCAPAAAAVQPGGQSFAAPVAEAAQRFGIPELWIWRVMHAESRGKAGAVSHAGAMGLMQIMPATWASLTARHRLGPDPFNPRANILAGAAYLRAMWDRFGDVRLMLAAYNAGPGRADAYASGRRGLPAETIAYVAKIAPELHAPESATATVAAPSPRPGWREAALFAERAPSFQIADPVPPVGPAGPAPAAGASLFIPLSVGPDR
ncbi:Lytic transglycosylase, catalytic precursor [Sphingopyxis sp. LC81]|jgi:soluble lytic murein transglycosylase-like protein|uniref:lytic transglycosylase domain-containing protein n=1 Tax=Sphingopyxis sp. LC81 TaxID=1502850 RepID=UPI00050EA8D0|nr:lytic transglycosylase domain-containing protein [Sphingopyxis sp. LC81]KGB55986.1 Lytic transglycosylase, catalytic precursor [Sphingopyxis sp. LC81]